MEELIKEVYEFIYKDNLGDYVEHSFTIDDDANSVPVLDQVFDKFEKFLLGIGYTQDSIDSYLKRD